MTSVKYRECCVAQVGITRPKIGPDISQPNQVLTRVTLCA